MNHALLPKKQNANLPATYEAAKMALAECNRIDECKDWGDKMQALASYAKQADDKEMEKTAQRIRARAVNRCGELLKEIEKGHGKNKGNRRGDPLNSITRKDAATKAGLSPDQAKQSIRVANFSEADPEGFETQLESDSPPTVRALAEKGKKPGKPEYKRRGVSKKEFQSSMYFRGAMNDLAKQIKIYDPRDIINGSTEAEKQEIKDVATKLIQYLTTLKNKI